MDGYYYSIIPDKLIPLLSTLLFFRPSTISCEDCPSSRPMSAFSIVVFCYLYAASVLLRRLCSALYALVWVRVLSY